MEVITRPRPHEKGTREKMSHELKASFRVPPNKLAQCPPRGAWCPSLTLITCVRHCFFRVCVNALHLLREHRSPERRRRSANLLVLLVRFSLVTSPPARWRDISRSRVALQTSLITVPSQVDPAETMKAELDKWSDFAKEMAGDAAGADGAGGDGGVLEKMTQFQEWLSGIPGIDEATALSSAIEVSDGERASEVQRPRRVGPLRRHATASQTYSASGDSGEDDTIVAKCQIISKNISFARKISTRERPVRPHRLRHGSNGAHAEAPGHAGRPPGGHREAAGVVVHPLGLLGRAQGGGLGGGRAAPGRQGGGRGDARELQAGHPEGAPPFRSAHEDSHPGLCRSSGPECHVSQTHGAR